MKQQEDGFTLIEILIVIAIIGVLATIAIPVFLNQRKSAFDSAVKSDIANIAIAIQTLPNDATNLAKGSLTVDGSTTMTSLTYFTKDTLQIERIPISEGIWWTVTGDSNKYCIIGYHNNGNKYTRSKPITYDSTAGGMETSGDACEPGENLDQTGTVIASGNLIKDPLFETLNMPDYKAGRFGDVASYHSAPLKTLDTTTPVGNKAIESLGNNNALGQGIIFYQSASINSVAVKQASEKWTVSIYAKAPAGTIINVGVRPVDVGGNYNSEATNPFVATGGWDRLSYTYTTSATNVGSYIGLQAKGPLNASGLTMQFAGPMVEKSPTMSPFRVG